MKKENSSLGMKKVMIVFSLIVVVLLMFITGCNNANTKTENIPAKTETADSDVSHLDPNKIQEAQKENETLGDIGKMANRAQSGIYGSVGDLVPGLVVINTWNSFTNDENVMVEYQNANGKIQRQTEKQKGKIYDPDEETLSPDSRVNLMGNYRIDEIEFDNSGKLIKIKYSEQK